eukprot:c38736_g1_i1 orf=26-223(+)
MIKVALGKIPMQVSFMERYILSTFLKHVLGVLGEVGMFLPGAIQTEFVSRLSLKMCNVGVRDVLH